MDFFLYDRYLRHERVKPFKQFSPKMLSNHLLTEIVYGEMSSALFAMSECTKNEVFEYSKRIP